MKVAKEILEQKRKGGEFSLAERARVNKAESKLIESNLTKKIHDIETFISNKRNFMRKVREDIPKILQKLRHISQLLKVFQ